MFWNKTDILWSQRQEHLIDNLLTLNGDVITIKEESPLKAVYVKDVLRRIGE